MLSIVLNIIIFLATLLAYIDCFRTEEGGWSAERGLGVLRFFTLLSNLFCALSALLLAAAALGGAVPRWIWLMKYIGTASVTVTLLTVLFFLAPSAGYKNMLSGRDFHFHLCGPLLAIVSFCFFDRYYPLSLPLALTGVLPVLLYGVFYLYKVVLGPDEGRWEDFYGYNKNGRWPVAFTAMLVAAALICVLLWALCRV